MSRAACGLVAVAGVVLMALLAVVPARSQPPGSPEPSARLPDPFPLRRVFLPADKLEVIVAAAARGAFRTLPKDEFEGRVAAAAQAQLATRTPPALVRAVYRGTYAPGGISGTAEWTVANPGGRPAALSLDALRVAVGPAKWDDGRKAAVFRGKLVGRELTGTYLWVEEPSGGTVSLPWSARGVEEPDEERFELGLPEAPLATLELTLPADRVPTVPTPRAFLTGPFPAKTDAGRVWKVAFGGLSGVTVSVRRPTPVGAAPVLAARTAKYDLTPGEVRAAFEFTLDSRRAVRDRVFDVDAGLRIESVSGATRDRWTFEPGADPAAWGKLTVTFREPAATAKLTVVATAPFTGGLEAWPFPGVRAVGGLPGADVIEATVHPDLKFDGWVAGDYRVTVPGVQPDRSLKVQFHGSLTATESGRRRPPSMRVRAAEVELATEETLDWRVSPDHTRLSARVKVRVVRGPLAAVAVRGEPGYVLDSVALAPDDAAVAFGPQPGVANGWLVEPARAVPTGRTVDLRLEFRGPPGPRPADLGDDDPPSVPVPFPRFAPVGVSDRQGTLTVTAGGGLNVAPRTVQPATVSSTTAFAVPFRGREPDGEAAFTPDQPSAGLTAVRVAATGTNAAVKLHARCDGDPLGGVTVFVPGDGGTVSADGAEAVRVPALSLLPLLGSRSGWQSLAAAGVPAALPGSLWRVRFARPVRGEFDITVTYPVTASDPTKPYPFPLPALLGCDPWEPQVTLAAELADRFHPPPTGHVRDQLQRFPPQLMLEPTAVTVPAVAPASAAWRLADVRLTTAVTDGDGLGVTFAGRVLEAAGRTLPIDLPAGAVVESAQVAGKWVPNVPLNAERVELPLPDVPPDGVPFEVRYRLPAAERWPLPEFRSPAPVVPGAPAVDRRWVLESGRVLWPTLETTARDVEAVRVARRPVVWAVGAVLAGLMAALGVRLIRTGRRRAAVALTALAVGFGGALWLAPGGWGLVVRPPFVVGVVLLAVAVAVHGRSQPTQTVAPNGGSSRSSRRATVVTGFAVLVLTLPTTAQAPEPATVYVVNGKDKLSVAAPQTVLDKLDALAASPLPAVVLTHAEYTGTADDATAAFNATFTLVCHRDGDHPFVLPLAGVRLERATLDGKDAYPDASKPDRYAVTVSGRGEHQLTVRFAVVPTATGRDREVRFDGPDVPSCRVAFRCGPTGRQPVVPTRRGGQVTADGSAVTAEHGGGRTVAVRWREAAAGAEKLAVTVKEAAVWDASDVTPAVTAAFAFRIDGGSVNALKLEVPDGLHPVGVRVIDPRGIGVRSWTVGDPANGWTPIDVRIQPPTDGRVTVVLRAVPTRPMSAAPVLRFPRAAVPAADRDSVYGVRFAGVKVNGMTLAGAIDFPPDTLVKDVAKDFPAVPEFNLDRAPPERVVRRAGAAEAELRPVLLPASGFSSAAAEVLFSVGRWAEADGAIRIAGQETGHLQFDVPTGCDVRDVRAAGLAGWNRTGTRVQVWLRQPTADLTVRWAGTLPVTDGVAELPLPRWSGRFNPTDPSVVRVRPADGYAVAPRQVKGWQPKLGTTAGELTYTADPTAPAATFTVQPVPEVVSKPTDPPPNAHTPHPTEPPVVKHDTPSEPVPTPSDTTAWNRWWSVGGWLVGVAVVAVVWRYRRRWWPECWVGLGVLGATAVGVGTFAGWVFAALVLLGIAGRLSLLLGRSGR